MPCSSCPSSSSNEKQLFYNVTAHNICNYRIIINGHTNIFSQSASASASSNSYREAAENARRLAKTLTNTMAREHINSYGSSLSKKLKCNNTTTYSV